MEFAVSPTAALKAASRMLTTMPTRLVRTMICPRMAISCFIGIVLGFSVMVIHPFGMN